jgi:hypothetical protein
MQYRIRQNLERYTNRRSLKSEGIGLSRYANCANPQRFSVILGSLDDKRKKFGSTPKRLATFRSNGVSRKGPVPGAPNTNLLSSEF